MRAYLQEDDAVSRIPGQSRVMLKDGAPVWLLLAWVVGMVWPPLWATMLTAPPTVIEPSAHTDWRILAVLLSALGIALAIALILRETKRTGRPSTRLGIIWRFLMYGAVIAAASQTLLMLAIGVESLLTSAPLQQKLGGLETIVLIYGVAGLPFAMLVGISHALWAGLAVALIAFRKRPARLSTRYGVGDEAAPVAGD